MTCVLGYVELLVRFRMQKELQEGLKIESKKGITVLEFYNNKGGMVALIEFSFSLVCHP